VSHVLLAGASGFLGTHLRAALTYRGHTVIGLTRGSATDSDSASWDPAAGIFDRSLVERSDVVVCLTGSSLFGNPHSRRWQQRLHDSRVVPTRLLAEAIAESDRIPAFLAGNGSSWYGDHGSDPVTESADSRGDALLTEITRAWQAATEPAEGAGARVCVLRTTPVMDLRSVTLKLLKRLYQLGLGGRLGDGRQYFPVVSLRDWTASVVRLAEHDSAAGPFNICCPETPTNAEFTAALGAQLHRPTVVPAPAPAIRVALGRAAPELLRSQNLRPAALAGLGHEFRDPDVRDVLRAGLSASD
jgi:uncharacterized protein (TIGR01777 family)